MKNHQIAIIVGSLRKTSYNQRLANALITMGPDDFSFRQLQIDDLPLYNQDDDKNQSEPVKRMKDEIRAADGLIFITPEYNRSVPGVLKNAIDHASRPYGDNVWTGKPAGVIGISIGVIGTALAQQHLRNILAYLDVPTMGQPEAFIQANDGLFDQDGGIGPDSRKFIQKWMDAYAVFVRLHQTTQG